MGPKYAAATVGNRINPNDPMQTVGDDGTQVGFAQLGVDYLQLPEGVGPRQAERRFELWEAMQSEFLAQRSTGATVAHDTVYRRAMRVMSSDATRAFELEREDDSIREA